MKRLLLTATALVLLTLAACGARKQLVPPEGAAMPVKPEAAEATPTANDLLQAEPQARPARSDDLIESSKERRSDEFDLPPPD